MIFMKRFIFATAFLGMAISFAGATVVKDRTPGEVLKGSPAHGLTKCIKPVEKHHEGLVVSDATSVKKSPKKEAENTFEVKCVFKYDHDKFQPSDVTAYNEENYDKGHYDRENDFVTVALPEGTYDFMMRFYKLSDTAMWGNSGIAYLILEDIDVTGDKEIELDAALITECISFETYNPDGEKSALRYLRYLNENWDWEIITEYNVYDMYFDNYIIKPGVFRTSMHANGGGCEVEPGPMGEWKAEWASNVYINPVSDKYVIAQLRMLYDENEMRLVPMFAEGSHTQTVTNKGETYTPRMDVSFGHTPLSKEFDVTSDSPYGMHWSMEDIDSPFTSWGLSTSLGSFHHVRYCETPSSRLHPEYGTFIRFENEDFAEIAGIDRYEDEDGNVIWEETRYYSYKISTPYFLLGNEGNTLFPLVDNRFINAKEGGMERESSIPEGISYFAEYENTPMFGNTPQYMQFYYLNYESKWYDYPLPMIDFTSIGYNGDYRDFYDSEVCGTLNGEKVFNNHSEFYEWQIQCSENETPTGELIVDYVNTNIEIDGLAGKNTAKVRLDNSLEDYTAPLIQAVQFRDNAGNVTERFNSVADGNLLIAGGDFQEKKLIGVEYYGETPLWYEVDDCTMTVEYAPYGSNSYSPIAMTAGDEIIHSFGKLYYGSLDSVDRRSETGWFDLRIVMEDAVGNVQEQIISPAFRVDELTGVQKVNANSSNLRVFNGAVVADNGLDVEVFTLSGKKIENRNLAAGIYLAKSGASVAKLVVK